MTERAAEAARLGAALKLVLEARRLWWCRGGEGRCGDRAREMVMERVHCVMILAAGGRLRMLMQEEGGLFRWFDVRLAILRYKFDSGLVKFNVCLLSLKI